tara:strand:- start:5527 stop:6315 length:789 start_codon:yes stop_codon:yes gene_type:complete
MLKNEHLRLIDCHTHLDQYSDSDIKDVIKRSKIKGVQSIVSAGVNLSSSQKNQSLALEYPNYVWAGVGIHPMEIDSKTDKHQLDGVRKLAGNKETVCISEIGLDYESSSANKSLQKEIFSQQIQIACEVNKPIVFHNRGASTDPIEILNRESNGKIDIVAHYFQGTINYTYMCLNNGFYISLAKTLLRMPELQDLVKTEIPLENIVLETDSYPQPFKKKRSSWTEPWEIEKVATKIADLKGIDVKEVEHITNRNASKIFGLD